MPTSLQGISNRAVKDKAHRFGNLYGMLNEAYLKGCFYQLKKDAAPGIDRVGVHAYREDLDANISALVNRLKQKRYRARLVRRQYIPNAGGKLRPLGIPATEDKVLQLGAARILEAIFEADFLNTSYASGPRQVPGMRYGT